jgi:hypothetical protein
MESRTSLCFISDASIVQLKSISCKWEKQQKKGNFTKKTVENRAVNRIPGTNNSENAQKQPAIEGFYTMAFAGLPEESREKGCLLFRTCTPGGIS